MDELTALEITLNNLFTKAVGLHDDVAHKVDILFKAKKDGEPLPALTNAGPNLTILMDTYKEIRDIAVAANYLAGNDIFTLMNDFKMTRPTVLKILSKRHIKIRKPSKKET